jgi:hypothetical protein
LKSRIVLNDAPHLLGRYRRTHCVDRYEGNESARCSFGGHVCTAPGGAEGMPISQYYRIQAKVLLMMMLAMRDSKCAKRVEAKAREISCASTASRRGQS